MLRPEEQDSQTLFVDTRRIPTEKCGPPLMEEDWVVLCQALTRSIRAEEWTEMQDNF